MANVPRDWKILKVQDFMIEVKDKINPTTSKVTNYVGLEHIQSNGGLIGKGVSSSVKSTKTIFKANDVLYGKLRPYLNKHVVADFDGVCSTDIVVYRHSNPAAAKYFNYWLDLDVNVKTLSAQAKGINLPRVSASSINALEIPVPPDNQMKLIVAKLDRLFGLLHGIRERLDKIPALLKQFRQAVLTQAVTGKLTEEWRKGKHLNVLSELKKEEIKPIQSHYSLPEGWMSVILGDYVENHDGPRIPLSSKERALRQGHIPYYGATGQIDSIDGFTHDGEYLLVGEDGANLLSRAKPLSFIVRGKSWINNHAHVLTCKGNFSNEFLGLYINSLDLSPYVTGSAQPKLTQKNMNAIPVPVPTSSEQLEIVRRVQSLFAIADRIEERYSHIRTNIEKLPQAILNKAFRGELVKLAVTQYEMELNEMEGMMAAEGRNG
jgi:type I restriction enzyme S subunit